MSAVTVELAGQEYPLTLTVQALKELMELLDGGLEQLAAYLSGGHQEDPMALSHRGENIVRVMEILLRGGEMHRRLTAHLLGGDINPRVVPDAQSLGGLLLPWQIPEMQLKALQAVNASMSQSVAAVPEKNVRGGED